MDLSETMGLSETGAARPLAQQAPTQRLPVQAQQPPQPHEQCGQCGAAVDQAQRHCVVCGAHLKRASDPSVRYFSGVARSRSAARAQRPARAASRGRGRGLGTALVLALIPVAAAIGVLAGRSSNNDDAKLIQALARRPPSVTVSGSAASGTVTGAGTSQHAKASHRKASSGTAHAASTSTKRHVAAASNNASSTGNGSVQPITGSKPTKAEEQQGAKATQQVQKSTGKSYVNSQTNLPSQVVVP
jgi:hypothetical protein